MTSATPSSSGLSRASSSSSSSNLTSPTTASARAPLLSISSRHHHPPSRRHRSRAPLPSPVPRLGTPPYHLTIRFSLSSLPDLHLAIPTPNLLTVAQLSHQIRKRLASSSSNIEAEAEAAKCRLRFIQAGRLLPPRAVLGSVLKAPPATSPGEEGGGQDDDGDVDDDDDGDEDEDGHERSRESGGSHGKGKSRKGKSKGKEKADSWLREVRVYVNCAIGDHLSDEELHEEEKLAEEQVVVPSVPPSPMKSNGNNQAPGSVPGQRPGNMPPGGPPRRPLGFDRLLTTASFSPAEVGQLRAQFLSIQSSRFTPDTMPSPDTLRTMEETWLESNNGPSSRLLPGGGGGGGGAGGGGDDDGLTGAGPDPTTESLIDSLIDSLIKGSLVGFFFPLGSVAWLLREEAMLSRRWRMAVGFGVAVSVLAGVIRSLG